MKYLARTSAAFVLAILTCGCEAQPAARVPVQREAAAVDITRATAIRAARADAARSFGEGWIAWVDAAQLGRYWVIELRAMNGKGLRYAISLSDGSIRQRSVFQ